MLTREEAAERAVAEFPHYQRLLWWMDKRIRRWLFDRFECRYGEGEFVGWLYQRYARAWRWYDPEAGRFSTYFCARILSEVITTFLRYESQTWDHYAHRKNSTQVGLLESLAAKAYTQPHFRFYRVPEFDAEWAMDVFEALGGTAAAWEELMADLKGRNAEIVLRRVRGDTLQEIGHDLGVTKERVRQIEAKGIRLIGERLKKDRRTREHFGHAG